MTETQKKTVFFKSESKSQNSKLTKQAKESSREPTSV